ncbi:hypothetical protein Godav_028941 [Gossypium davidsonii]|uniref:Transposase-associated domain-containing protein n=2 Tax=Gossypium TaxID=3633 RepID=A0A7J8TKM4_GOSDV|nr:hypothetical protein [Gossypium davidsonii]MBA0666568.1 hypothetical protein [Gossypium klotzschianum]
MNGIASFTEYATKNCINSQNIYCSCKKCSNRVFLRPEVNSPNIASHTRSLNDTDVDLGTRDLIREAIGLNVPVHDKDEFIHSGHVNGRGDFDSTSLPSKDVR